LGEEEMNTVHRLSPQRKAAPQRGNALLDEAFILLHLLQFLRSFQKKFARNFDGKFLSVHPSILSIFVPCHQE